VEGSQISNMATGKKEKFAIEIVLEIALDVHCISIKTERDCIGDYNGFVVVPSAMKEEDEHVRQGIQSQR
jgi:hypothetical protein